MNFDNIVFISKKFFRKGYLLRETKKGVILEKYYNAKSVDVIAEFIGKNIRIDGDLEECIKEARKYITDKDCIIYVDLNRKKQK